MYKLTAAVILNTLFIIKDLNRFDCMDVMKAYKEAHNVIIDHHEFSYLLDVLHRVNYLRIVQPGGFTVYSKVGE